ncbi:hypothetical protein G7Z17_g11914 [Cylindrodendrum hubeiense]|uniref:Uncharacterized protein n=1 Tax=Cylindrodendrum hubeiense TaxID=595255 RepID=A0A9P5GWA7_9HYPO|nr:hypothetical protein G7Z17_g11914 [Cylindrodendrum hubeiense]
MSSDDGQYLSKTAASSGVEVQSQSHATRRTWVEHGELEAASQSEQSNTVGNPVASSGLCARTSVGPGSRGANAERSSRRAAVDEEGNCARDRLSRHTRKRARTTKRSRPVDNWEGSSQEQMEQMEQLEQLGLVCILWTLSGPSLDPPWTLQKPFVDQFQTPQPSHHAEMPISNPPHDALDTHGAHGCNPKKRVSHRHDGNSDTRNLSVSQSSDRREANRRHLAMRLQGAQWPLVASFLHSLTNASRQDRHLPYSSSVSPAMSAAAAAAAAAPPA